MVLRQVLLMALIGAVASMTGGAARAEAYRPGAFLGLDLNQAALSPQPLGPPAQFEPVRGPAIADPATRDRVTVRPPIKPVHPRAVHPRIMQAQAVRKPVIRPRTNPLDAQASDTRIQVWPCRSGGICNWHRRPAR